MNGRIEAIGGYSDNESLKVYGKSVEAVLDDISVNRAGNVNTASDKVLNEAAVTVTVGRMDAAVSNAAFTEEEDDELDAVETKERTMTPQELQSEKGEVKIEA